MGKSAFPASHSMVSKYSERSCGLTKTEVSPRTHAERQSNGLPRQKLALATMLVDGDPRKHRDMHNLVAGQIGPFAERRLLEQHPRKVAIRNLFTAFTHPSNQ